MGQSSSKRITKKLKTTPEFITSIQTTYNQTITLSQQTFPGIPRYQIPSSSDNLYQTLITLNIPLIEKYVTGPPSHAQITKALQRVIGDVSDGDGVVVVGEDEFREFVVDLYVGLIVAKAEQEVIVKVASGVAGIVGVGAGVRVGLGVVGTVVGVYAVGVATSVYLSLG